MVEAPKQHEQGVATDDLFSKSLFQLLDNSHVNEEDELTSLSSLSSNGDKVVAPEELTSSPLTPNTSPISGNVYEQHESIFDQLHRFAASSPSLSLSSSSSGAESNDTSFLLQSPCRQKHERLEQKTPRHGWGKGSSSNKDNMPSLQRLRDLERSRPHKWTNDQRTLLCILYRFYKSEDLAVIPRVFNTITKLSLRAHIIHQQFKNHLLLYGLEAFPHSLGRVFAVPFYANEFLDQHQNIESCAKKLGVKLQRRTIEGRWCAGKAKSAKSELTRKSYNSMVQRATAAQNALPQNIQMSGPISQCDSIEEEIVEKEVVDCTGNVSATNSPLRSILSPSKLAFRVWDDNSQTQFSEENGFTSEAHLIWRGQLLHPPSIEGEGEDMFLFLANLHLSMTGNASSFVSVTTSLLQAFVKASNMLCPRISVIDLTHPTLVVPNKIHHAEVILKKLKRLGQAWWARYRGVAEYMIWANVPPEAIIHHFSIEEIVDLAHNDSKCAEILGLQYIIPHRRTKDIATDFRKLKNTLLSISTAKAMARITGLFLLGNISLDHICVFVARLVDGFCIQKNASTPLHTMSSIAAAFATEFVVTSQSSSHQHFVQDVMRAFVDGIEDGLATIEFYARCRRRPYTRRQ